MGYRGGFFLVFSLALPGDIYSEGKNYKNTHPYTHTISTQMSRVDLMCQVCGGMGLGVG